MSVHQGLTIRSMFAYFENIARMLTTIGHDPDNGVVRFARAQYDEAAGIARTGIKSGPALFVDHYTSELIDAKSNNLVMQRTLAFAVMMPLPEKRDYDLTIDRKLQCETVALQVVARLYKDRLASVPAQKKFINVLLDDMVGDFIEGPAMVGYEVRIPVQNKEERLIYDAGLWDDDAAAPILQDLTALSCENLNHPSLGLTTAQRTNCLYVRILAADGTTEVIRIPAGGTYTLTEETEMAAILPYATLTLAQAATAVTPSTSQVVHVVSTGRFYPGNGTSTVADLVNAKRFLPSVTENNGLTTVVEGETVGIELFTA